MRLSYAVPQIDEMSQAEIENQVERVSAMGYEAVEFLINDPKDVDKKKLKEVLDRYNVCLSGLRTGSVHFKEGVRFSSPDAGNRKRAVERVKEIIELASEFDTCLCIGLLQGNLLPGEKLSDAKAWIKECLRECAEYAGKYGVDIMYEPVNRFELNYNNTVDEMIAFTNEINEGLSHKLLLLLDTFHMNIEDDSINAAFVRARNLLGHVHYSDSNRCAPGTGNIDFSEATKILKALDYKGFITVEILPVPDILTAAEKSINYLKALL